jgi:hypothetical protein
MKKNRTTQSAFFRLRAAITLLICAAAACSVISGAGLLFHSEGRFNVSQRTLTFAERVAYQRAIEEVYWRHRILAERKCATQAIA